jgi:hypothetical protein
MSTLYAIALLLCSTPTIEQAALTRCPTNRRPPKAVVAELFHMERAAGVPEAARGILAGAACQESAFRADPGKGDGGKSWGIVQFASWAIPGIRRMGADPKLKDPRLDWRASARYWLKRLKRNVPKARRACRGRRGYASLEQQVWMSANLTAVTRPKCIRRGKCRERDNADECVRWYCAKIGVRCATAGKAETKHALHMRNWHRWVDERQRKAAATAPRAAGRRDDAAASHVP